MWRKACDDIGISGISLYSGNKEASVATTLQPFRDQVAAFHSRFIMFAPIVKECECPSCSRQPKRNVETGIALIHVLLLSEEAQPQLRWNYLSPLSVTTAPPHG